MKQSPNDRVGSRFAERYDLLEVLGTGGMGTVYRAKHAFTGASIALKIMHPGVATSANARQRFLREAQAPTSIEHPGIVKVHDAGIAENGMLYLALELLEGIDLATAIERGTLEGSRFLSICVDILDCLDAAHRSRLVHRDIKPENVFLCSSGSEGTRVRLLDFGITRALGDNETEKLTQTGSVLGTPHYMSPEQARGQPVDARSDIYSVGGMMFFALTGRHAFVAANYNLLIVAIVTNSTPPVRSVREDIPPDVAAVVDRALATDPNHRFQSAAEMRAALLACVPSTLKLASLAPPMVFEPTVLSLDGASQQDGISVMQPHSAIHSRAQSHQAPPALIAQTVASSSLGPAPAPNTAPLEPPTRKTTGRRLLAGGALAILGLVAVAGTGVGAYRFMQTPPDANPAEDHLLDPPSIDLRPPVITGQGTTGDRNAGENQDEVPEPDPQSGAENQIDDASEAEAVRRRKEARLAAERRQKQRNSANREQCIERCRAERRACTAQSGDWGSAAECSRNVLLCTARCN